MVHVIITAAGLSERFSQSLGYTQKKEFIFVAGLSVLEHALTPFLQIPNLGQLIITTNIQELAGLDNLLSADTRKKFAARLAIIAGGNTRQSSVRAGLEALAPRAAANDIVLIHDGARPNASGELVQAVLASAQKNGACIPLTPLRETLKKIADGAGENSGARVISEHPVRAQFGLAQTPQGFTFEKILLAHRAALAQNFEATDDAQIWDRFVGPVSFVAGEENNIKLTYASDIDILRRMKNNFENTQQKKIRIGQGWDIHRLVAGRPLMLAGIAIPADFGEEAHSDGDVLLHAVIDALLGALSLGDIGSHFPPSDPQWKNADSKKLLGAVLTLVENQGYHLSNLDATIILEKPKLGPHRDALQSSLASLLKVQKNAISIKAKTNEALGEIGRGEAISAEVVLLLEQGRG